MQLFTWGKKKNCLNHTNDDFVCNTWNLFFYYFDSRCAIYLFNMFKGGWKQKSCIGWVYCSLVGLGPLCVTYDFSAFCIFVWINLPGIKLCQLSNRGCLSGICIFCNCQNNKIPDWNTLTKCPSGPFVGGRRVFNWNWLPVAKSPPRSPWPASASPSFRQDLRVPIASHLRLGNKLCQLF